MTLLDRRSKMVSFRLSPREYQRLQSACAQYGVRSVSELARSAMEHIISSTAGPAEGGLRWHDEVRDLREQVKTLSSELNRLAAKVATAAAGD